MQSKTCQYQIKISKFKREFFSHKFSIAYISWYISNKTKTQTRQSFNPLTPNDAYRRHGDNHSLMARMTLHTFFELPNLNCHDSWDLNQAVHGPLPLVRRLFMKIWHFESRLRVQNRKNVKSSQNQVGVGIFWWPLRNW